MGIDTAISEFRKSQIFSMTLAATTQRSRIYSKDVNDSGRIAFHLSLRSELEKIGKSYTHVVSDDAHVKNITSLATSVSQRHAAILNKERLRIGHAQKALNLYLKYLWCFGDIPEPPHCPIDFIILQSIPGHKSVRWTHLDSIDEYKCIINDARKAAAQENLSLAQWELVKYNK